MISTGFKKNTPMRKFLDKAYMPTRAQARKIDVLKHKEERRGN